MVASQEAVTIVDVPAVTVKLLGACDGTTIERVSVSTE